MTLITPLTNCHYDATASETFMCFFMEYAGNVRDET